MLLADTLHGSLLATVESTRASVKGGQFVAEIFKIRRVDDERVLAAIGIRWFFTKSSRAP